jgi:hypothetical protein
MVSILVRDVTLDVNWRVKYFNMEGRTDGKNMRAILNHLCARRVILVHGSEEATEVGFCYGGRMDLTRRRRRTEMMRMLMRRRRRRRRRRRMMMRRRRRRRRRMYDDDDVW